MRGVFIDASEGMAEVFRSVVLPDDPEIEVHEHADVHPADLPGLLAGCDFVIDDHNSLPTTAMRLCPDVRHVVFLGTGARSYMNPEELAGLGITVHTIKGYGDVAVAEHAMALMFAAARGIARMDRGVRAGGWPRTAGMQLGGKTLGLLGYGGIAAEVARMAAGIGMRVTAWNRTPREAPGVEFVSLERLLSESHVLSLHLLLNDDTRGFLGAERLALLRPGVILVNTARAAVVDPDALLHSLASGRIGHAALDVFETEPLPAGDPLTRFENVTLSAHSGFHTPEATQTLVRRALDIAKTL
jgi:D-3-phosphoglycerate dehydrogenase